MTRLHQKRLFVATSALTLVVSICTAVFALTCGNVELAAALAFAALTSGTCLGIAESNGLSS